MTNNTSNTQFNDAEALVKAQQFPAALQILNKLVKAIPDHQGALYLKAVCHRYLQDLSQAIDTLNTLQAYYPDYGRTYQELGHCYRAQAKFAEAITAYQQAVQLHPGLLASWQQLALLFAQINEPKLVQEAQDKIQEIQSLPKYLLAAQSAFYEGRLAKAENLTREFLQKNPSHVPGMRLLAKIAVKLNILDDAQILLENATVIAPHSTDLKLELIQVLQQRQLFSKAHELALQTYLENPKHALSELAYANQCVAIGNTAIAINHFTNVLSELTSHAAVYVQRGHAYKTIGEPDKAIADYVQASELKPDFGDAYWSLANLKTFVFSDAQINTMKTMLARPGIQPTDKYHICFALGKAFEDHQDYAQAFSYYEQGNTLKHQQLRYNPDETTFSTVEIVPYIYERLLVSFLSRRQKYLDNGQLSLGLWQDENNSFHLKGLVVDNRYHLLTGSNLNPRAWALDLENGILLDDEHGTLMPKFTEELQRITEHTTQITQASDIESVNSYPEKPRKLLKKLRMTQIDRLLKRFL